MKRYQLICLTLFAAAAFFCACEWDGPTALWDQPYEEAPGPSISNVNPAEAEAGVNYITIAGSNFSSTDENIGAKVYFDGYHAEVMAITSTEIRVRRPNITGESTIKVVNLDGFNYASYGPYTVGTAYEPYGDYDGANAFTAMTVDRDENVYTTHMNPRSVYKVTPDGSRTEIGLVEKLMTDILVDADGNLVLLFKNDEIHKMNVTTGEETLWIDVGEKVAFGDFDSQGNLYAGGIKTDLVVVQSDETVHLLGTYASDRINAVRVYNGYVYLLVDMNKPDEEHPDLAIWRHPILDASGNLGPAELVLNWEETGEFAESTPADFTFDEDGILYVATDYTYPILMVDPSGPQDILYKDIIPTEAQTLVWGAGNDLYMVQGDADILLRIFMGKSGAPVYGG